MRRHQRLLGRPVRGLSLCYEFFDFAKRIAPKEATPEGYTRDDTITGMFLQVTLHELGHGMFDIYNIPVLGREEDAADQMAGFILSQFGPEVARRTLPGAAYVWQQFNESRGGEWPHWLYSDEHGHDLQRSYNYLCMAYGSDPTTFAYYVDWDCCRKSARSIASARPTRCRMHSRRPCCRISTPPR